MDRIYNHIKVTLWSFFSESDLFLVEIEGHRRTVHLKKYARVYHQGAGISGTNIQYNGLSLQTNDIWI